MVTHCLARFCDWLVGSPLEMAPMSVHLDFSGLRKTTWSDYAIRFLLGGAITMLAGVLAKLFGPVFGGLFLAFPAIFPASATLVEKHEIEKKQNAGMIGKKGGRRAAALDSRGATIGCLGLICFAAVVWRAFPNWNAAAVLIFATLIWFGVSTVIWNIHRKYC
jgi:hypothetical protein